MAPRFDSQSQTAETFPWSVRETKVRRPLTAQRREDTKRHALAWAKVPLIHIRAIAAVKPDIASAVALNVAKAAGTVALDDSAMQLKFLQ